jgi:hypothetical protein
MVMVRPPYASINAHIACAMALSLHATAYIGPVRTMLYLGLGVRRFTTGDRTVPRSPQTTSISVSPAFQRRQNVWQHRLEPREQFPSTSVRKSDPDHGWTYVGQCLALREVFILRYYHRRGLKREIPDCRIGRGFHPPIGNVLGLMSLGGKPSGERGRKLRVDNAAHQASRNTG